MGSGLKLCVWGWGGEGSAVNENENDSVIQGCTVTGGWERDRDYIGGIVIGEGSWRMCSKENLTNAINALTGIS